MQIMHDSTFSPWAKYMVFYNSITHIYIIHTNEK